MAMCNVRDAACNDKSTENYQITVSILSTQLLIWLLTYIYIVQ